jgi:predicted lipid-binding transport protein (Tim44 family)
MRSFSPFFGAALLALTLAAAPAVAQVYKWTDANGQVHFGDRGPSNATQVKAPTPPTTAPAAEAAPAAAKPAPGPGGTDAADAGPPAPVSPQQSQQVRRDVASARVQQCKDAREAYDKSVRALRMYRTNDKGEREFVSAAEADGMRLQLKASVDAACGS